jgi:hypothetical protein
MAEFKPMVKMQTTEPSVVLKLKKGGPVKMAFGGKMSGAIGQAVRRATSSVAPTAKALPRMASAVAGAAKKAVAAKPTPQASGIGAAVGRMASSMPQASAAKMPAGMGAAVGKMASSMPLIRGRGMKEGGESSRMHAKEMSKLSNLEKEMKSHEGKKASVAHKGLKTGGVVNGQGGFKTGGVVKGQGGYKEGGAAKKHYATGGVVNSGAPVVMPKKPASKPVRINELAGTVRNGGGVSKKC